MNVWTSESKEHSSSAKFPADLQDMYSEKGIPHRKVLPNLEGKNLYKGFPIVPGVLGLFIDLGTRFQILCHC